MENSPDSRKKVLFMTPPPPPVGTSPMHYGDGRPMLGLGFLAAYIEQFGHTARLLDNFIQYNDIEKEIQEFEPDFVGIYVNTTSFLMALELIQRVRRCAKVPIICGGPHATVLAETLSAQSDYVVVGEGELALKEIIESKPKVKVIRKEFIKDLDTLPWPNYRHFIGKPYNWKLALYKEDIEPTFTMNTSRGCPFRCSFCAVESIWGKEYRFFSAEKIVDEISHLIKDYGAKGIYFREDNFTAHRKRLDKFCSLLEEKHLLFRWVCETRADLEQEYIRRMASLGCVGFYVGVESGSQRMLDFMCKSIELKRVKEFFADCKASGVKTYATICYGIPGETEDDRTQTEDFLAEVKPDAIDRFVYAGVPGSPLYRYLKENKLYYHLDESGFLYTDNFKELIPRYWAPSLLPIQFLERQMKALKERSQNGA